MKSFWFLLFLPVPTSPTVEIRIRQEAEAAQVTVSSVQLDSLARELRAVERRVERLSSEIDDTETAGFLLFLFAVFCALWAQNTGRSPWLWFFMGGIFNVVTVLFLLSKNAQDRRAKAAEEIH